MLLAYLIFSLLHPDR
ncbi:hypothetical protein [Microlunatus elymi]